MRRGAFLYPQAGNKAVAKVSIGEFVRQVKVEGFQKVVWPSRQETFRTTIMVMIMTGALALFFLATDSAFSAIVQFLLGLLGPAA
jgi:preprotein translocase subunit SecE